MATGYDIPRTPAQVSDQTRLLIRSVGLAVLEKDIYKNSIPVPITDKPLYKSSMLGTPVMSDLTIKGRQYVDAEGVSGGFDDIRLETVIMTVGQQKNIVTTKVQGRNSTVKEYISDGDYAVLIKGMFTASNGKYPYEQMDNFARMIAAPVALDVSSWFLQLFGIFNVVITFVDIPQTEGAYSQQTFEIQAYSDDPIQLKLT